MDWWYHNRGHASVRMATRIARRVPTVWINGIGMRMPVPGRTEIAGGRYLRKLESLTKASAGNRTGRARGSASRRLLRRRLGRAGQQQNAQCEQTVFQHYFSSGTFYLAAHFER